MSYDLEVQLYPELLRRLAAGEHLASVSDETEKLAATALVVEAIEAEKKADEGIEKSAIVELGLGAALGAAAAGPAKRLLQKMRGEPAIPEHAQEILKSFRRIMEERMAADAAKRKLLLAGAGGAVAGAAAVKLLEKNKNEKTSSQDVVQEEKKADAIVAPVTQDGVPAARALLDRIMKSFQ